MLRFIGSFVIRTFSPRKLVYLVTSVEKDGFESRCWGWFKTLKRARRAVLNNEGDMHETTYTHVVIEACPEGVCAIGLHDPSFREWYKINKDVPKYMDRNWEKCEPPKWSDGIIGYGVG